MLKYIRVLNETNINKIFYNVGKPYASADCMTSSIKQPRGCKGSG